MKILYAASEAVPFCKTGGLADVAGSLPAALAAQGADVAVVLPLYQKVKEKFSDQLHFECYDYVDLAWRHSYCGLFSMERDGVTWYFLDNEQYFRRPELYGYMDDGERFGFFSRAVVRMLPHLRFPGCGGEHGLAELASRRAPLQRLADRPGAHLSEGRQRAGGAVPEYPDRALHS